LRCFRKLQGIKPDPDPLKAAAELIGLYCYSLDLPNFVDGEKIAMYLLQKHRKLIAPQTAQIQTLLGRHSNRFLDLVTMFIDNAEAISPLQTLQCASSDRSPSNSIGESLAKLHASRQKTGDFTIVIKGQRARKVHAFVMHSAWPYFRRMFDAGLKEKQERRLSLPQIGEDGGVDEEVLDLIIELGYYRDLVQRTEQLRGKLSVGLALQILSISELYLQSDAGETNIYTTLVEECTQFAFEDDDHCLKAYRLAIELKMDNFASQAKQSVLRKFPKLAKEPATKQQTEALPKKQLHDLLFSYLEAYGY
jgi:hypothetical protein